MKLFLYTAFLIPLSLMAQNNVLKNPGYEDGQSGWSIWGGEIQQSVVHSGSNAFSISLSTPQWSGADQVLQLTGSVKSVKVGGWMKTENIVQGSQSYEQARIAVEFLDDNNQLTGGYPPVTGQRTGTNDWKYFERSYSVPEGATRIKIQTALGNCTGTAWYDDMSVILLDANGNGLEASSIKGPDDEGKWYELPVLNNTGSHYVDWSKLLDAPAGKHGFVKSKKGHLEFADGTPARFWGVNVVADNCFLSKDDADSLAQRLSRMGCNMVRLHHMDAAWSNPNIFGNTGSTRTLSKESLDKLDYLISAFKKKGIYIFLDLLVHRDFTASDGVPNRPPDMGGKQVAYFDTTLIRLQKEYIKSLLTHKNKYTGLTYTNEPAIVASEFINESSAYLHFGGDILTPHYSATLSKQFQAKNPGKTLTTFDFDYSTYVGPTLKVRKTGDTEATMKFLSETERNYYKEMYAFMRSLGVQYPLSGSNFPSPVLAYQFDNYLETDLIITNDYWDHPQLWKIGNNWDRVLYAPLNNTSMYKSPERSVIGNIMRYRWLDKPLIVTEYNACYPNEYRLETVPYVAAYSKLQDIDGMLQFDFDRRAMGYESIKSIAVSKMPEHLAGWVVAAPLFHRNYVKTAPGSVVDRVSYEKALQLPSYSDFLDKGYAFSYITKVGKKDQSDVPTTNDYNKYHDAAKGIINSETGELSLDYKKGIFSINTPYVQGFSGALKNETLQTSELAVALKNSWAGVYLVSADGKVLTESKHMYLVVICPVKNTGQKFNDNRSALLEPGKTPVLAQVAEGEITLKTSRKGVSVKELDHTGKKGRSLKTTPSTVGIQIKMDEGKSFVYEVKF